MTPLNNSHVSTAICLLLFALCLQLFATSSLLRRMGMSVALGLAPVICLAALFGIVSSPLPWVVAVSEVLRKVFGYAVLRPAREVSIGFRPLIVAPLCSWAGGS